MRDQPTFIDLFAGIGGIRLGFERAGARCIFSSEWDPECCQTYEANFGDRPAGDIAQIRSADIPDHDILAAGFPCQPFSILGDGRGFRDTRGTLFFEVERILRDRRPSAFLLENVRQLVTHDGGQTFTVIRHRLQELGYQVYWRILNGLDFGVPQKRERVVIVGFRESVAFRFPDGGMPRKALREILEPDRRVPDHVWASPHVRRKVQGRVRGTPPRPSIWHENMAGHIGVHPFSCALRANASYNYLLVNGERRLTPREMLRLQGFPDSFRIVVSDAQARKQAGNSVVVPKIEAVARAIVAALRSHRPQSPARHLRRESLALSACA